MKSFSLVVILFAVLVNADPPVPTYEWSIFEGDSFSSNKTSETWDFGIDPAKNRLGKFYNGYEALTVPAGTTVGPVGSLDGEPICLRFPEQAGECDEGFAFNFLMNITELDNNSLGQPKVVFRTANTGKTQEGVLITVNDANTELVVESLVHGDDGDHITTATAPLDSFAHVFIHFNYDPKDDGSLEIYVNGELTGESGPSVTPTTDITTSPNKQAMELGGVFGPGFDIALIRYYSRVVHVEDVEVLAEELGLMKARTTDAPTPSYTSAKPPTAEPATEAPVVPPQPPQKLKVDFDQIEEAFYKFISFKPVPGGSSPDTC